MDEFKNFINGIGDFFVNNGWNFLLGVVVLIVGLIVVKALNLVFRRLFVKGRADGAVASFIIALVTAVLDILIAIVGLSIMGINTASILTVLATCGVAIGLALKDSLGNIASGMMIIFNKPFKKGDYISVAGVEGKIDEISLFNTTLTTWDNKRVVLPNSSAVNNPLVNCDATALRRVDVTMNFDYGTDVDAVRAMIAPIVAADERISKTEPYVCLVTDFGASALVLTLRAWTDTAYYWDVRADLLEDIYNALYSHNMKFAYTHMSVDATNKQFEQPKQLEYRPRAHAKAEVQEKPESISESINGMFATAVDKIVSKPKKASAKKNSTAEDKAKSSDKSAKTAKADSVKKTATTDSEKKKAKSKTANKK